MAEEWDEFGVDKVCMFLMERNVANNVIQKFRHNKMDARAVSEASKEDLQQLGLTEKGHILCLKSFALSSTIHLVDDKKRLLANAIKSSASQRITKKIKVSNRLLTKQVQVGWKHARQLDVYTQVRGPRGGGVRELTFKNEDTLDMVKEEALKLFFPGGKSTYLGRLNQMNVGLGDFAGEVIKDLNTPIDTYVKSLKMSGRTRLYILTKQRTFRETLQAHLERKEEEDDDVDGNDDDDDFELFPYFNKPKMNLTDNSHVTSLVGSSKERNALHAEIDQAYRDSLLQNQEKTRIAAEKEVEEDRLKALMECRKSRVLEQPDLHESNVTVIVRHPTLGEKSRLFRDDSFFQQVYDWIGGESLRPEHFELKSYNGTAILPEIKLYSGVFNMLTVEKPILMSPEGSIAFHGFGVSNGNDDRVVDVSLDVDATDQTDTIDHYAELEQLRDKGKSKLSKEIYAEVERENVYKDLLKLYRKRNIITSNLELTFKSECAVGDGVARDVYSEFYQAFYQKMEGHFDKVPAATFDDEELQIIGKIITHAFLLYDIFPVELSRTSLKYYLHGSVSDEELYQSFLSFITPKERDLVNQFKDNSSNSQAVVDILSDYSVFGNPTPANVFQLIVKAAKVALIRLPCFPFQALVEGMGYFWDSVTDLMIESLYKCTILSAEEVIDKIVANEVNATDQKISTWLHRYIRSCTQDELARFIRFITGSETLLPNSVIKVEFSNQPETHLHPSSKTCFKILILPRQYSSFYHLRDNLNFYISNPGNWAVYDMVDWI